MTNYTQIDGQWWYIDPNRGNRMRVYPQTCSQCGKEFVNKHKQKCCSKKCSGISQRGNQQGERPCAWCKKLFIPRGRGNRQKCCSLRCAYDLGNTKRGSPGPKNGNWKGGKKNHSAGYVYEWVSGRGSILKHRLVMEQNIGRRLERYEEVHHKNGIRNDNRLSNLELWAKRHPGGQRVKDLIEYAEWVLETYGPLKEKLT